MTVPQEVWVREDGPKYRTSISAGAHTLVADEPIAAGGGDVGPQPFEYLLGALGACTSMTVRMYADRKGWKLGRVAVRLTMDKVDPGDGKPKIDRILREIVIEGDIDDEQRRRLVAIAEHCPVHKFMLADKKIETAELMSRS
ncbi:MAG: OsmC family protein [Rhodospirillales bacterium]|nr:OsmC family protein [Rhodospirillales bacterium]